jgi:hypothetical protein
MWIRQVQRSYPAHVAAGRPSNQLVADVADDSPAEAAGIERGDVLLALGDTLPQSTFELAIHTSAIRPGQHAQLVIARGDRRRTLTLDLSPVHDRCPRPAERIASHTISSRDTDALGIDLVHRHPCESFRSFRFSRRPAVAVLPDTGSALGVVRKCGRNSL